MNDTKTRQRFGNRDFHLVIICDREGIFDAFEQVKNCLSTRENLWLSFIYATSEDDTHPLFEQELSILEYRFFEYLLVYQPKIESDSFCFKQELLEAIVNSSLSPSIKFILFGSEEFVNHVDGLLRYLSILPGAITITIKNNI